MRVFLTGMTILILSSCSNIAKEPSEFVAKQQVALPNDLEVYNSSLQLNQVTSGKSKFQFKIFTAVNTSCATCLAKIEQWEQFSQDANKCAKTLVVPVCNSKDKFEMLKFLIETKIDRKLNVTLLLDSSNSFQKLNPELASATTGLSVLTDAANSVLFTGNPTETPTDRQRFIDKICEKANQKR